MEDCITSAISSIRIQASSKLGAVGFVELVRGGGVTVCLGSSESVDPCAAELNGR